MFLQVSKDCIMQQFVQTDMNDQIRDNNTRDDAIHVFIIMQGKPESYWIY